MGFPYFVLAENDYLESDDWNSGWENDTVSPWHYKGFIEGAYGRRLQNDHAISQNNTLNEIRGRLDLEYTSDTFQFNIKGDALYDDVLRNSQWRTREVALSFSPVDSLDIKAGRQITTWGTGDYVFLNDLFPKDWQSFFSGRDDEYLKAPADSLKASWFAEHLGVDIVWSPKFTPDNTLSGERFSFFSPVAGRNIAPDPALNPKNPSGGTLSARLTTNYQDVEYAFYGYKGYWTMPLGMDNQGRMIYTKMNSFGASLRTSLGKGVLNSEFSWYDSAEDRKGSNPNIPNSQLRWLLGYEQEVVTNLTASVQYYLESTQNYAALKANSPHPQYLPAKNRQLLTMRLTWQTLQQKLIWSLFTFWSPSDKDVYLKPSITYRVNDNWSVATGANLFYGNEKYTFFGQHENNSNAWMRVRLSY
ncbi:MAG: hypothetical protein QS748_02700 [Candidatus Endonucleobacter bathymodioli]|uniref:Uncharacterized protein n=1 Tax=Candidatus Endonucleibacter bathymodioli TaxID=539814 RepID=A0AA90NJR0_9GAMM|nr:hypothetical protein [Candidatus Endonucleobacter bathymodioli]